MKNYVLILSVLLFVSCSKTPEEKANVLIKQDLRKSLYKPDTYNPVETKIDSAYYPKDSPDYFLLLEEIYDLGKQQSMEEFELENAESSMSIWGGPYSTELGQTEYKKAKKKYDQAKSNIDKILRKGQRKAFQLLEMAGEKKRFIGWKVYHNYRADNNAGQTLIGNQFYIIDKDFTKILYNKDEESFDNIVKMSEQFEEQSKTMLEQLEENGVTIKQAQERIDSLLDAGYSMEQISEGNIHNQQ